MASFFSAAGADPLQELIRKEGEITIYFNENVQVTFPSALPRDLVELAQTIALDPTIPFVGIVGHPFKVDFVLSQESKDVFYKCLRLMIIQKAKKLIVDNFGVAIRLTSDDFTIVIDKESIAVESGPELTPHMLDHLYDVLMNSEGWNNQTTELVPHNPPPRSIELVTELGGIPSLLIHNEWESVRIRFDGMYIELPGETDAELIELATKVALDDTPWIVRGRNAYKDTDLVPEVLKARKRTALVRDVLAAHGATRIMADLEKDTYLLYTREGCRIHVENDIHASRPLTRALQEYAYSVLQNPYETYTFLDATTIEPASDLPDLSLEASDDCTDFLTSMRINRHYMIIDEVHKQAICDAADADNLRCVKDDTGVTICFANPSAMMVFQAQNHLMRPNTP